MNVHAISAQELGDILTSPQLKSHFQPIMRLGDGAVHGHEALIRVSDTQLRVTPKMLFNHARETGRSHEFELRCMELALQGWSEWQGVGHLFVNVSASTLVSAVDQGAEKSWAQAWGTSTQTLKGLVIELTEHERVDDVQKLSTVVAHLRREGAVLALDDFGDGRSSLRLWSELKPEFVKIDQYFTREVHRRPEKVQTLRALKQLSEIFGSKLVAEGIETPDELHVIRDLGIEFGQGWIIGYPQAQPVSQALDSALQVLGNRDIALMPQSRRLTQQRFFALNMLRDVSPVPMTATNEELFARFAEDETLEAVAIVNKEQPVGLVSRQRFVDSFVKPFFREIYGRRPCTLFANAIPRILDIRASIDEMMEVLTSEDQRYLLEGFIFVEDGRYRGLGRGADLVRAVTESRIEAARHANPLTLLPGNIPLTQHIGRLLGSGREFVACYCDLNHFKPFNDLYGYWRGDGMIQLAARTISSLADARRDFVGHVGGDDFVVLFQSEDWESRCQRIIALFNQEALQLYDEQARNAGGVMSEDRYGTLRFHPLTTMSMGIVRVPSRHLYKGPEDVADASAQAKRLAKSGGMDMYVIGPFLRPEAQ